VTPLRVGIVGYGYTGKIHAQAYLAHPTQNAARLVAVADSESDRLNDLPGGVRGYTDFEKLLDSEIDAVNICLPTYLHCEFAVAALSRGKHVLVEKPIAASLGEARQMLQAARIAGRILYVGMTHRFYPELREAKKLLDDGLIGSIVACNDCVLEHLGFLGVAPWYLDKSFAGGGVALTSGVHLVDRVRWFTGDEVAMVAGSASNRYFGANVEDAGQMYLRFRGGISAQLTMAFMREPHPLVCNLQVVGTRGSLNVHTWQGFELWNESGRREVVVYTDEPHRAKVQVGIGAEISEFCASILQGRTPWPPAQESVRSLEVITAYYASAASGRAIELAGSDAL